VPKKDTCPSRSGFSSRVDPLPAPASWVRRKFGVYEAFSEETPRVRQRRLRAVRTGDATPSGHRAAVTSSGRGCVDCSGGSFLFPVGPRPRCGTVDCMRASLFSHKPGQGPLPHGLSTVGAGVLVAALVLCSCEAPAPPPNSTVFKDWKIADGGRWIHLPGARDADGTGYLSSFHGLKAIDEHTGFVKWTAPTVPKEEWETVMRAGDLVLAYSRALKSDSSPHYLRALDAQTGSAKWRYENLLAVSAPIAVGGKSLWILNRAGELVLLDLATGKPGFTASLKSGSIAGDDFGLAIGKAGSTLVVGRGQAESSRDAI